MPQVHPQIQALLDGASPPPLDPAPPDLAELRAGYVRAARELGGDPVAVASAEDVLIAHDGAPPVPVRVYLPTAPADPLGVIIWNHGGGWVIGNVEGFDLVARELCEVARHVVVSVDYRLAPEHPFPAPVDDAEAALRWVAGEGVARYGIDPARIVIGGDSAGGQIAAHAALRAPGLAATQLLVYPAMDPAMATESYRVFADAPMLTAAEMALCWHAYRGEKAAGELAVPADLSGAPQARIALAAVDPLRDDGVGYAAALRRSGVDTQVVVYEDMTHGFLRWGGAVDRAHELIAWLAGKAAG